MSNMLRENWRAVYTETCKSGSEGSSTKPNTAMCHGRVVLTLLVLPGTVYDEEHGQRVPLFFSRNRKVNHIDLLHEVTEKVMVEQIERYVGPDWEQRYDELAVIREEQRQIVEEEPHGKIIDDKGKSWNVWCGMRRRDEQTSAVGYYRYFPAPTEDDPDALRLEFRPLITGLPHGQATFFAQTFAQEMHGEMNKLKELTEIIRGDECSTTGRTHSKDRTI